MSRVSGVSTPVKADWVPPPCGQRVAGTGHFFGGRLMILSGLTYSVIHRASLGNGYVRVRDSGLITAVAQFLYDQAALLDEWRLDEWLALFHPEAARYLIPSPEDLSDDPATTLHLVNDSMTILAGRVARLRSKHAHAESPRSRTRRQITNVRVWWSVDDLLTRSVGEHQRHALGPRQPGRLRRLGGGRQPRLGFLLRLAPVQEVGGLGGRAHRVPRRRGANPRRARAAFTRWRPRSSARVGPAGWRISTT